MSGWYAFLKGPIASFKKVTNCWYVQIILCRNSFEIGSKTFQKMIIYLQL